MENSNDQTAEFQRMLGKRTFRLYMNSMILAKDVGTLKSKIGGNLGAREVAIAVTKIEEAEMWIKRGLDAMDYVPDPETPEE